MEIPPLYTVDSSLGGLHQFSLFYHLTKNFLLLRRIEKHCLLPNLSYKMRTKSVYIVACEPPFLTAPCSRTMSFTHRGCVQTPRGPLSAFLLWFQSLVHYLCALVRDPQENVCQWLAKCSVTEIPTGFNLSCQASSGQTQLNYA